MKYRKDLFLKNGLLYQKVMLKNHSEQVSQFVLPKNYVCKVILASHDDNGHLGMERTLGLLQEQFVWPKWQKMCGHTFILVIDALNLNSHKRNLRCNQT